MVVPSHTVSAQRTKQETKYLFSCPMTPLVPSSTSAKPGQTVPTVMLVPTSPLNLTMWTWDGLSRDIVMEQLHLLQLQSYTPLPSNAGGTTELNLSPLIIGLNLTCPPMFLELVFAKRTGSTNARVGPMVYGARWQPTNRRKLIIGRMHGLVLEPAMACLHPRPVQVYPPLPVQARLRLPVLASRQVQLPLPVHLPVQASHLLPVLHLNLCCDNLLSGTMSVWDGYAVSVGLEIFSRSQHEYEHV